MTEYRILVKGLVQAVGFRAFAKRAAFQLGLAGYVRNLADGSVEVIAQGDRGLLESFVGQLRQGPPFAKVEDVVVEERQFQLRYDSFAVR